MDTKKFGAFLKELRKEQGYTQNQLAEKLSVSNKSVSRWERGINMPDMDILIELSDLYKVSIRELLSGERISNFQEEIKSQEEDLLNKISHYNKSKETNFKIHCLIALILGILSVASTYFLGYHLIEQVTKGYFLIIMELSCYILLLICLCIKRILSRFDMLLELNILSLTFFINNILFYLLFFPKGIYSNQGLLLGYLMILLLSVGAVFVITVIKILIHILRTAVNNMKK